MHGAVGTALGGVTTLVGEPQNLLIAEIMDWEFLEFFLKMAHISMPVLVVGLITCASLEMTGSFGYGAQLSPKVRAMLEEYDHDDEAKRTMQERMVIVVQAVVALVLIHRARPAPRGARRRRPAGDRTGDRVQRRHRRASHRPRVRRGAAVHGAAGRVLAIVAVIHEQGLFTPVIHWVMTYDGKVQQALFYLAERRALDDQRQRLRRDGVHQ